MDLVTVKELYKNREQYFDKEVTVGGWVRSNRDSKAFGFIVVNDGSYFETLQVVYHDTMDNFAEITKLNVGAAIIVKGTLVATPQAKQPFEIQATEVVVEGASTPDYPLQKKRHSIEYLRTISHLRPRTNTFQAVFRVRSLAAYAIHKFFQERGFVYVNTPLITGSDCEGAGEMFQVTTLDMARIAEEGIKVNLTSFQDGPTIIAAMESGSIDIGYIGHGAHKLCIQGNAKIFALSHISNGDAVIGGPDVKTLEDLKGKKVAYSSGTSSEDILKNALAKADLTMDDIEAVEMEAANIVTAMLSGGVDVKTVQEVLGHENLNTTQIYTHIENTELKIAAEANPLSKLDFSK